MGLVREGMLRVDFDLTENRDRIGVLAKPYEDRTPGAHAAGRVAARWASWPYQSIQLGTSHTPLNS